ncbi:biotin--[acetyl-CoA-carboxylase] ligase [Butyrivibrio sp. LC3010]|uniref:biotin--[acetyl-CoA-carboxylase] ligase n=1 Tax=Butyrivibrio sp. LC3010 TaxID=1280680 RepID=UPI00042652F0|nr:biotin--[acetyl-CoA-carboxylase] ligase [Butyrivibrio sp. LC3010]
MPDTKSKVLKYLEDNRGQFSSGETIASELNLSRNSVWKAIESLRREGFRIEAASRRGYFLSGKADRISKDEISLYLDKSININDITIYETLESTNKTAKSAAVLDARHGSVIISEIQSNGTGKRKSSFTSPKGGIYMSIILRPENLSFSNCSLITPLTTVCICKALEASSGLSPSIKWMNEIYLNDKKVCGILTESGGDFDTGDMQYVVVGIGIYFSSDSLIENAKSPIGSLFKSGEEPISRNELIAYILNELLSSSNSEKFSDPEFIIAEYKKRLKSLGKTVTINSDEGTYTAKAIDIDKNGKLIVELPDKTTKTLSSEYLS